MIAHWTMVSVYSRTFIETRDLVYAPEWYIILVLRMHSKLKVLLTTNT